MTNVRISTAKIAPVGKRVAKQRQRVVTARELLSHDAGADNSREQKGRPQTLGNAALRQRWHHVGSTAFAVTPWMRPISRSFFCKVKLSSEPNGSAVNIPMR